MSKEIIQLNDKAWAATIVPYQAHLCPYIGNMRPAVMYWDGYILKEISIPPGKWQILGLAKDLTEDQWKEVVDKEYFEDDQNYYYIYEKDGKVRENLFYDTAKESGFSLLKSKGLSEDTTLIIIKTA